MREADMNDHFDRTDVPASAALFARAAKVTPGGVNSPVRAFRSVGGTPRFMVSGKGPYLTDADGREYVDLVGSWGPMILGHSHPRVIEAVRAAVDRGLSFGTPGVGEVALGEEIVARVGPVQQVRLVSSGTEATMSAIRLARGFTGRAKIVKFAGCYHGHVDALLASAGSGVATFRRCHRLHHGGGGRASLQRHRRSATGLRRRAGGNRGRHHRGRGCQHGRGASSARLQCRIGPDRARRWCAAHH